MSTKTQHDNRVAQVAREYRKKGYTVTEPLPNSLPPFLDNFQPDLIATNEIENVVIEVRLKQDINTLAKLKPVIDKVNSERNWRFELIVLDDKKSEDTRNLTKIEEADLGHLEESLSTTHALLKQDFYVPAFLAAWAAFESITRQLLVRDKMKLDSFNPIILMKGLRSMGYVSDNDFEFLESCFKARNNAVHGFQTDISNRTEVSRLITIIQDLVAEE